MTILHKISRYASLVKISHTIFALPFAAAGFFLALRQGADAQWQMPLVCAALCMFFARNAAMSFNRYADQKYDALNPRTAGREIPQGVIKPQNALFFCIANALCFVAAAAAINALCLALSPLALLIILGYSYTKRFTALCHFVLGLGLAAAPVGAYIAAAGRWSAEPLWLSAIVLLWTAGFDIIYALPDEDFDKNQRLHSIPAVLGVGGALKVSAALHAVCAVLVVLAGVHLNGGVWYFVGGGLFTACLIYQHSIVAPARLTRINLAFATLNGIASVVFGGCLVVDCLLG